MGSDAILFFTHLFSYHYENKWLQEKKGDNRQAIRFANVFRFIDNLTCEQGQRSIFSDFC